MNMKDIICDLPGQLERAWLKAASLGVQASGNGYGAIYIGGMGGSAIAGDILSDYAGNSMTVPIRVVRGYTLPPSPAGRLLFLASSYSGNTEEVLSLLDQAEEAGAEILVATSGGILKQRAEDEGYPSIDLPAGYPPRGALGYSFASILFMLRRFYPALDVEGDLGRVSDLLKGLTTSYASGGEDSEPYRLANIILGRIPVIYVSSHIASVAVRWTCQFSENAKVLAFVGVLPEIDHNEISGWENYPGILKDLHVLILRDSGEHRRVAARMEITGDMIRPFSGGVTAVESIGKSLLERIFSLIYKGDFVSFYLSHLLDTDPMTVSKIDELKDRLLRIRGG